MKGYYFVVSWCLISILLATPYLFAQNGYFKAYGAFDSDSFQQAIVTSDNGLVCVGATSSYGAGDSDVLIMKLDLDGSILWANTVGGSQSEYGYRVQQTSDNGFIVSGYTDSFGAGGSDLMVLKFHETGSLEWAHTYGGSDQDLGFSVIESSSGGYIVLGQTSSFGEGNFDQFLLRISPTGTCLWSKTIGGALADYGRDCFETGAGNIIISGISFSYGAGSADFLITEFSSNGTFLTSKTVGLSGSESIGSMSLSSDNGFIIAGTTYSFVTSDSRALLIKFDSGMNLQWTRQLGELSVNNGENVCQTSDGGYLFSGTTNGTGFGSYDIFLSKFDGSGNLLWTKTGGGVHAEHGKCVRELPSGDLLLAGFSQSYGKGNYDGYLARLEPDGTLDGCALFRDWTPAQGSPGLTVAGAMPTIGSPAISDQSISPSEATAFIGAIDVCGAVSHPNEFIVITGDDTDPQISYHSWQVSDGGFISCGKIMDYVVADNKCLVERYNPDGKLLWARTANGPLLDIVDSCAQLTTGEYVFCGWTNSFGAGDSDALILKYNVNGDLTYAKCLGGADAEHFEFVYPGLHGGFFACGLTEGSPTVLDNLIVVKVDSSENIVWSRATGNINWQFGMTIYATRDGGCYAGGGTFSSGGDENALLIKYDDSGNIVWARSTGGTDLESITSVRETFDGGCISAGHIVDPLTVSIGDILIMKHDRNGNLEWAKVFGLDYDDASSAITQRPDGGYYLSGTYDPDGSRIWDLVLAALDSNGNLEWVRSLNSFYAVRNRGMILTPDFGLLLNGEVKDEADHSKSIFMKTNDLGLVSDCDIPITISLNESDITGSVTNTDPGLTNTSISPTVTDILSIIETESISPSTYDHCRSLPSVVINEVVYENYGAESENYIELFGAAGTDLENCQLHTFMFDCSVQVSIDLTGYAIPANGCLVIGHSGVPNIDIEDDFFADNISSNPCNGILLDWNGFAVDAIQYNPGLGCSYSCGEGDPALPPETWHSLSRYPDGADSDDNLTDFCEGNLTPGEPNVCYVPITGVWHDPANPEACSGNETMRDPIVPVDAADPVCLYLGDTPNDDITSANLWFRINGGTWTFQDMELECPDGANDYWWTYCDTPSGDPRQWIPGEYSADFGSTVDYYFEVTKTGLNTHYLYADSGSSVTDFEIIAQTTPWSFTYPQPTETPSATPTDTPSPTSTSALTPTSTPIPLPIPASGLPGLILVLIVMGWLITLRSFRPSNRC